LLLRPVTRLGTCMAPIANGVGAAIWNIAQRRGSVGDGRGRMRRIGHRDAINRLFTAGVRGLAVECWCINPCCCNASASQRLAGVPRYSDSATTSAFHAAICAAIASTRTPPPARMFQDTIRMLLDTTLRRQ
jgi:hypothetical protein